MCRGLCRVNIWFQIGGETMGKRLNLGKVKEYKVDGYKGVFFIIGKSVATGKPEKIYYIRYRKNRKAIKESIGRQYQDSMTPAKASNIRASRINGELSNREKQEIEQAKTNRWTIIRLWEEYQINKTVFKFF